MCEKWFPFMVIITECNNENTNNERYWTLLIKEKLAGVVCNYYD